MKYTNSLIFSISVVFLLSILSIFTTFYFFAQNNKDTYYTNIIQEYINTLTKIDRVDLRVDTIKELEKYLNKDIIKDYRLKANIMVDSVQILNEKFEEFNIYLLTYNNNLYILLKSVHDDILINTNKQLYKGFEILFLCFLVTAILVGLFVYIIKKMIPLRVLKTKIDKYGEGNYDISFCIDGKDEIADVANSLDKSITKVHKVLQSRDLFLRNIMHEIKTPITKGKILVELLDDEKRKKSLLGVFLRLENMVKEFVFVEQMVSKEFCLDTKSCRIVDIIDEAIDLTMLDRENFIIETDTNLKINVDFKFFSIAIKNLLDNAIKYSPDKIAFVIIKDKEIIFKNRSNPLKHNIEHYLQPFVKETHSKSDSFGLGLYIVHSILTLHNMRLEYEYSNELSSFKIIL